MNECVMNELMTWHQSMFCKTFTGNARSPRLSSVFYESGIGEKSLFRGSSSNYKNNQNMQHWGPQKGEEVTTGSFPTQWVFPFPRRY